MRITDWKEGVWYTAPGVGLYRKDRGTIVHRDHGRDGDGNPGVVFGAANIFRDDWTEVVTDPRQDAFRSIFKYHGSAYANETEVRDVCDYWHRIGWAAREAHGLKIDVEAAADYWYYQRTDIGMRDLLDKINAGEFRVHP